MRNEKLPIPESMADWQSRCLLIIADAEQQLNAGGPMHGCENPHRALATIEISRMRTWVRLGCDPDTCVSDPSTMAPRPSDPQSPARAVLSVLRARLAMEIPGRYTRDQYVQDIEHLGS